MTFAAWLDRALHRKGMTAAELARAAGIDPSVISRWRRDAAQPDVANLRRLASVLGVPMIELLVVAGHLSPEEARVRPPTMPSGPKTLDELVAEIEASSLLPRDKRVAIAALEAMRAEPTSNRRQSRPA